MISKRSVGSSWGAVPWSVGVRVGKMPACVGSKAAATTTRGSARQWQPDAIPRHTAGRHLGGAHLERYIEDVEEAGSPVPPAPAVVDDEDATRAIRRSMSINCLCEKWDTARTPSAAEPPEGAWFGGHLDTTS